ncbi:MAG: uroporphyrinogen decarboxylase family protein [Thermoproteota archaeon]
MNDSERILAVFEGKPVDRVPWNIRHEYWYLVAKASGKLPEIYVNMSLAEVCADLGASWRCYSGYFVKNAVKVIYGEDVEFLVDRNGSLVRTTIKTPVGVLREVSQIDEWGLSSRRIEYMLKSVDDFKAFSYLLENAEVRFDQQVYEELERDLKMRGIVSFFFPHSSLQALILDYMGFTRTMRFLYMEGQNRVEEIMNCIERYNDKFFRLMVTTPIKIFNLGENIDVRLTSPKLFEKFCLPTYQERCEYLHRNGKFVHIHVDGYAKPLLPLLRESGVDGVEALTPEPVGDMSIEDVAREFRDEIVVLDGIPFLFFLPNVPYETLEKFVMKIVRIIPRLVLGISDELPPPADVERVRMVSKLLDKLSVRK